MGSKEANDKGETNAKCGKSTMIKNNKKNTK